MVIVFPFLYDWMRRILFAILCVLKSFYINVAYIITTLYTKVILICCLFFYDFLKNMLKIIFTSIKVVIINMSRVVVVSCPEGAQVLHLGVGGGRNFSGGGRSSGGRLKHGSRATKSATAAGRSHRSRGVRFVGWEGQEKR